VSAIQSFGYVLWELTAVRVLNLQTFAQVANKDSYICGILTLLTFIRNFD